MDHSQLDFKRIAVVFQACDSKIVIRGICRWVEDELLGHVLQVIDLNDPAGESALLLHAHVVLSAIEPDTEYDCDYSLALDSPPTT